MHRDKNNKSDNSKESFFNLVLGYVVITIAISILGISLGKGCTRTDTTEKTNITKTTKDSNISIPMLYKISGNHR